MKVRLKGDSVRLRLGVTEVRSLAEGREVVNVTHLPAGARLQIGISPHFEGGQCAVSLDGAVMTVAVAREIIAGWAQSPTESLLFEVPVSDEHLLRIAIEKDYGCLKARPLDEDVDTYTHPAAGSERC